MRKQRIIRRNIWKLNEHRTRVRFKKRVKELVSADAPDLWKIFKDGVLKACDEVRGAARAPLWFQTKLCTKQWPENLLVALGFMPEINIRASNFIVFLV